MFHFDIIMNTWQLLMLSLIAPRFTPISVAFSHLFISQATRSLVSFILAFYASVYFWAPVFASHDFIYLCYLILILRFVMIIAEVSAGQRLPGGLE